MRNAQNCYTAELSVGEVGVSCVLFTQGAVFRVGGPIYLIPMTSKLASYAVSANQGIRVT